MDGQSEHFLNKNYIKFKMGFQNHVDNEVILSHIL